MQMILVSTKNFLDLIPDPIIITKKKDLKYFLQILNFKFILKKVYLI